jgi:Tfp pilus assembly protein PilO
MRTRHADRLWAIGGAVGAIALLAIGWFFFISPQQGQTRGLLDQTSAADLRVASLQHRLVELRQQKGDLPLHRAELARARQALPTTSGLSDLLRELQDAGGRTGVVVSGVIVGAPAQVTAAATQVYTLPITLTATGGYSDLAWFLRQLQQIQPRAVLISTTTAAPGVDSDSLVGPVSLSLGLEVFVAPPTGPGKAPSDAKPN